MSADLVALVIYDSVLFNRTGQVRRWADRVERRFTMLAKFNAPERSGELRAGISGSVSRVGPVHLQTTIQSVAPHTMFVLKGTTGPIMSNRMWAFRGRTGLDYPRSMRNGKAPFSGPPNLPAGHAEGYVMRLRPGGGWPGRLAVTVSGQEANNFFGRAAEGTAARHSSLRGFAPGTNF